MLIAAIGWEIRQMTRGTDSTISYSYVASDIERSADAGINSISAPLTTDEDAPAPELEDFSPIGIAVLDGLVTKYNALQDQGMYTEEVGKKVAEKMASALKPTVPYTAHTSADIKTDSDTSYDRILQYRADLRDSLLSLLKNTQPEFEIFAYYVDTRDTKYLERLKEVAGDYRDAASKSAGVVVPQDAVEEHLAILNAMEHFAAMLDAMAANATDPFASVALLRTYNQAEADMLLSFQALTVYYKQKQV